MLRIKLCAVLFMCKCIQATKSCIILCKYVVCKNCTIIKYQTFESHLLKCGGKRHEISTENNFLRTCTRHNNRIKLICNILIIGSELYSSNMSCVFPQISGVLTQICNFFTIATAQENALVI